VVAGCDTSAFVAKSQQLFAIMRKRA